MQYQLVWETFYAFMSGRGLDLSSVPRSALESLVCNFLAYASKNLNARPPVQARPMQDWSLNLVLSFLDCPLFEPLHSAELV